MKLPAHSDSALTLSRPPKNRGVFTLMEVNQSIAKLLSSNSGLENWQVPNVVWNKLAAVSNNHLERDTYEGRYQGITARATVTHDKKADTYSTRAKVSALDNEKPAIIRSF